VGQEGEQVHQRKPGHIAIIMDGNGRWAKARGLPRLAGHQKGAQVLRHVVEACLERSIGFLTVYAFSSENWQRPVGEVKGLFSLMEAYLDREEHLLLKKDICVRVIGERERLPPSLQKRIHRIEELTAAKGGLVLQVALSYGSRREIVGAARCLVKEILEGQLRLEDVTEATFAARLETAGIPDPDLLIRTSGEQRISNYLLWQLAYSELVFCPKNWPDFTVADLEDALTQYAQRDRRYGMAS
jgi:undecaprenyl diphosphate synthase